MPEKAPFLPYGRQVVDDADIAAVTDVLRGDWLTTGPHVDSFETAFARSTGADYAVACSSGTAALHLAMLALDLDPGDRVVVPAVTFLATANAVRYVGAEVVFADVDPDTGLLTPDGAAAAVGRADGRVRAILPVHMAGQLVDLDGLSEIARRADAVLVEDACHALGGQDAAGRPVGACTDTAMATFSLHPVKAIAAGEGGVVTTNEDRLAARLRRLRNHGMVREGFVDQAMATDANGSANPWYYEMPEPGFNYRLSDINAALARSQLAKLPNFTGRRRELVARYDRLLAPLAPTIRPIRRVPGSPGWHLYVALIDFATLAMDRAALMTALRQREIGSQVHYMPLHRQPYYRNRYGLPDLPGADAWYARALSLPLYPAMSDTDVDRVVDALVEITGAA